MHELLFLKPVFKEMIWGGNRMRETFNYDIPGDDTGEAWIVSAHPQGDCAVTEGTYKGKKLSCLWQEHRELFGNLSGDVFPLLVKIIDAKNDLSIQVHPDDSYAKEQEHGALGKRECWYILDCDKNASIIVGHNASSKEELARMIHDKRWSDLIRVRPIKPGDFFQIEPGTVHAIKGGTLLIETQQNSSITYRLYDYDRLSDGKPRELHIDKSIDVIRCPHEDYITSGKSEDCTGYIHKELVSCSNYTVDKYDISESLTLSQDNPFLIMDIIDGKGTIDGHAIKKGDNLILPNGYGTCTIMGTLSLITSHI